MAAKKAGYVPKMSDESVKAKTGKAWAAWFAVLDKAGAAKLDHTSIADLISKNHAIPGWWCQTVTVEYERARGLRARHQTTQGFSVGVNKTVGTTVSRLYAATASVAQRKKWFPKGEFEASSQTKDKYLHGSWNGSSRLDVGFYPKGESKSQIAIQVNKLADPADVERERKIWKAALIQLQELLEKK